MTRRVYRFVENNYNRVTLWYATNTNTSQLVLYY